MSERALALALKMQVKKEQLAAIADFLAEEYQKLVRDGLLNEENKNGRGLTDNMWESTAYLKLLADYEFTDGDINWDLEFQKITLELKKEFFHQTISEKTVRLKEAEQKNDAEAIDQYLKELQNILKEIS